MNNLPEEIAPKKVEDYLDEILYDSADGYIPSEFALEFINFIKLVNGEVGEEHKSPVVHYRMLDKIAGKEPKIINMCSRGLSKTTLLGEYLFLYIAVFGAIPGFGEINLALYVSDSIENGVKNMRKNLEYRWENSEFLQRYIPYTRLTDVRWEFKNTSGNSFVVKGYGAKCLKLDEKVITDSGFMPIGAVSIGTKIFTPAGIETKIIYRSPIQDKKMYRLSFKDGRNLEVTHDHLNWLYKNKKEIIIQTDDLTNEKLKQKDGRWIFRLPNIAPIQCSNKKLSLDPYTLGILLGDGDIPAKNAGVRIMGLTEDIEHYVRHTPYSWGIGQNIQRKGTSLTRKNILGITDICGVLGLRGKVADNKIVPEQYLFGSIIQRKALLAGLLDTDGYCSKTGKSSYSTISKKLSQDFMYLIRSLGGTVSQSVYKNRANNRRDLYKLHINTPFNPFTLPSKSIRWQLPKKFCFSVPLVGVVEVPRVPSICILVDDPTHLFIAGEGCIGTHNTGVRGAKEMGVRPQLAVLDDLVSDEDARSTTVIESIEATVNKAVNFALHPTASKTIWSGTPFNAKDPLYKAVESGAWAASVYPICEKFPCSEKEFKGAWPDRFNYDYVNTQYVFAMKQGKIHDFNQELMLRIMSDEERLITDSDIQWYKRSLVLESKAKFNFYITTDFATSERNSADFSVISVWALNNNGDWFWVDGVCKRQLMDKNIDDLFMFSQKYSPQAVGIEVSGQQEGFIPWIQKEMLTRNIYFNLGSQNNATKPGIRPNTNKMVRFNVILPLFKARKMFFPIELKTSPEMLECMDELTLVSINGFKSKNDDFIDTISMLSSLVTWRPSQQTNLRQDTSSALWDEEPENETHDLDSYIV